jgi:predicted dienelactone hydrolase
VRIGLAALFCLGLFALGCGTDEEAPAPAPTVTAPDAPGPYAVGVTTIEAVNGARTLPVEVWYPARPGGAVEEYVLKVGVLDLAHIASPLGAVRDAKPDLRGGPHPVVVFSHGNGGTRIQSVYLTEWLATHGFVVAAPDHVGNTFAEMINKDKAIAPALAASVRPVDVSKSLDALLAASAAPEDLLAGVADPERVAVAGHSFGGFTALRVAGATIDSDAVLADCAANGGLICDGWQSVSMPESARDPRFRVALAQAPGGAQAMYAGGRNGFSDVAVPTMIQGGTSDQLTPYAEEHVKPFESLPAPAWLLGVDKAGHFTFSDMCRLIELVGLSVEEFKDGCGPDNLPWQQAHTLIQRVSTAFFQVKLQGEDRFASELDPAGPLPPYAAVLEAK